MKKRLLITSIVMMLVVAVALGTSTYAWFTSNSKVTADSVVLTAATMNGDAILIAHNADASDASNMITLAAHTGSSLYPATPKASNSFTTFDTTIADIGKNFQNLIMDGSGKYIDPSITSPNVSFYKDTFYVFNKGYQARTLVPVVTITYDSTSNTALMAAKSARIAIIERTPSAEVALGSAITTNMSTYTLKGIWQFSNTAADDTAVITGYVHPTDYADVTYYADDTGAEYTGDAVTSENFDTLKDTVYVAQFGNNHTNVAAKDADSVSGYGAVEGSGANAGTFTQGSVAFTSSAFTAIPAATSGNHIANEYTVIVWLEGWDADCTNAITAGTFNVALSFTAA